MTTKFMTAFGIMVGFVCLALATAFYPGGFDWNTHYISTVTRGPSGISKTLADAGIIVLCVSVAWIFGRLSRVAEFAPRAKIISIAGIGSMVYSSLTITPLHDLMVSISIAFFLVAVIALVEVLYSRRETGLLGVGCLLLALFVASVASFYTGFLSSALPWAQRLGDLLFAAWLVALDFAFPRAPSPEREVLCTTPRE